jgi:hypothetical protein
MVHTSIIWLSGNPEYSDITHLKTRSSENMFKRMKDELWKLDIPKYKMSCDNHNQSDGTICKLWKSDPTVSSYNFTEYICT